jgi:hypothetical protein
MSNETITRRPRRRAVARRAWWVVAVLVAAGPMLVAALKGKVPAVIRELNAACPKSTA